MSSDIVPGIYKIVSLIKDNHPPTSVNLTLPGWQTVYLNGPVTAWVVRKESKNTYLLSLGGYPFTGVDGNKVIATIHEAQNVKWRATYRKHQNAYTIELLNGNGKGWTVAEESDRNSPIELRTVIMLPIEPPQFSTAQLFRFERV